MLHLRVLAPPPLATEAADILAKSPAVAYLCVSPGVARKPAGDMISCDVAREAVTGVLQQLRETGLERDGAIVIEQVDLALSASAVAAKQAAPGEESDALIWEDLEQAAGRRPGCR